MTHRPLVSVVIATYNSDDLLAETLRHLTRQTIPADAFEVIVGDDGSSDRTAEVVRSFAGTLTVKYVFQEDRGFRAGAARNAAAALAAGGLLVILDTGSMAGPGFLAAHLAAHKSAGGRRAVLGYGYGYDPDTPMPGVDDLLAEMTPEAAVERFGARTEFQDARQSYFTEIDPVDRLVAWQAFWTLNCSIRTDDFRRVGGFEEVFHGWGGEDIELGFRLRRAGVTIEVAPDAWVVVAPHDRDQAANYEALFANMRRFLRKSPEPVVEMGYAMMTDKADFWSWEQTYRELVDWQHEAGGRRVGDEIAEAVADGPEGGTVAIVGCGAELPASLTGGVLLDFDRQLLDRALQSGDHSGYHAVGLHTTLADDSVDTVIITSRMSGLWATWSTEIRAEADRIGRRTVSYAATEPS